MDIKKYIETFLYSIFTWILKQIKIEVVLYSLINAYAKQAKNTDAPFDNWIAKGLMILVFMITGKENPAPENIESIPWLDKVSDWIAEKHSIETAIFTAINSWQAMAKKTDTPFDDWIFEGLETFYEALVGHKDPLDVEEI